MKKSSKKRIKKSPKKRMKKTSKKSVPFIIPSILITLAIFVFFQFSETKDNNFLMRIFQKYLGKNESKRESFIILGKRGNLVVDAKIEDDKELNEETDLIESSSYLTKMVDEKPTKIEKSDSEVLKIFSLNDEIASQGECNPCEEEMLKKSYIQGEGICRYDLPMGYNAPGRIDICKGRCFITADFIYWESLADQLDLGTVNITAPLPQKFEIIKFNTSYQPGFKVGVGTRFKTDDWDLYSQYTRLHEKESTSYNPANKLGNFLTSWFQTDPGSFDLSQITSNIVASWKVDLDKVDLELGRSYYLGSKLIAKPIISLSYHSIDQSYALSLTEGTTVQRVSVKNDSWSLGPRFGFSTSWFMYKGFNLFGSIYLSLMFAENQISGSGNEDLISYRVTKVDKHILRDVEEFVIGLGWGSYFTNDRWHFNISLAYEAQRYSHTNYMSYVSQMNSETNEVKPGDLYMHGMTISTRFDF
ncbi:MAG: hypothetical protein K1060chlam1_00518 [Candidatus Anoxychlamydiales bacterium]|nr:hypothetical protein [Candidatus Anoxychlamydiales bacterium]